MEERLAAVINVLKSNFLVWDAANDSPPSEAEYQQLALDVIAAVDAARPIHLTENLLQDAVARSGTYVQAIAAYRRARLNAGVDTIDTRPPFDELQRAVRAEWERQHPDYFSKEAREERGRKFRTARSGRPE